jgi:cell division protein FtsB
MDSLSAEIISLKNENAELKREIEKLETNSLDHTCLSSTANNIPGFDLVKEIQERETKSRNII